MKQQRNNYYYHDFYYDHFYYYGLDARFRTRSSEWIFENSVFQLLLNQCW